MVNLFALALLSVGDTVLLLHRIGDVFGSGLYGMVGGKVKQGETALQAIQREVREEVGLTIPTVEFRLVHTLHRKGSETEFVALCFRVDISQLPAPCNNEPDKCDEKRFFVYSQLPQNIIPAHKQIIESVQKGVVYSEHGW